MRSQPLLPPLAKLFELEAERAIDSCRKDEHLSRVIANLIGLPPAFDGVRILLSLHGMERGTSVSIFEASLPELISLRESLALEEKTDSELSPQDVYLLAMIAFFEGNLFELERLSLLTQTHIKAEFIEVRPLFQARTRLLARQPDPACESDLWQLAITRSQWRAEALYLRASLRYEAADYSTASEAYLEAQKEFARIKARKKALNCFASHVAAQSWIFPERTFLSSYFAIYRQARQLRANLIASTALLNLSREYQKLGAQAEALRSVRRALALLRDQVGSLLHYLLLTHYCHLLRDSGQSEHARLIFEYCQASPFREIQAALRLLNDSFSGSIEELTPTWRERWIHGLAPEHPTLSDLEGLLIRYLGVRPRSRPELRQFLYGARLGPESSDQRLKSLLERIRRKVPGLLQYDSESALYSLSREHDLLISEERLA